MAFDPNAYLSKKQPPTSGGFNPDSYLAKKTTPTANKDESGLGAFVEGLGQGAFFGYLPQIKAALPLSEKTRYILNAPIEKVFTGEASKEAEAQGLGSQVLPYEQRKQKEVELLKKSQEESPSAALTGQIASIATPNALLGLLGKVKAVKNLPAITKAVTQGAISSAVYNPGDSSESSTLQLPERAQSALIGGAFGGGVHAAGGALFNLIQKKLPSVKKWLEDTAQERAAKSLGRMTPSQAEALGEEGRKELGKVLINAGIVGPLPKTTEKMSKLVDKGLEQAGKSIGNAIDKLSAKEDLFRQQGYNVGLDKQQIASAIMGADDLPFIDPDFANKAKGILQNFINSVGKGAKLTLKEAQAYKMAIGKKIPWESINRTGQISDRDAVLIKLYGHLSDGVLDAAEGMAKLSRDPSIASDVVQARKLFTNLSQANKILGKQLARDAVNRTFSLTDYVIGGAGLASGNAANILLGAANKGAREYGSQLISIGSTQASKILPKNAPKVPETLAPNLIRFLNQLQQNKKQGAQ